MSKVATSSSIHVLVRVRVSSGRLLLPVKGRAFILAFAFASVALGGLYDRALWSVKSYDKGVDWIKEISYDA